ncbi:MAG: hypothetical protein WAN31_08740 [Methylovirgula sp.]
MFGVVAADNDELTLTIEVEGIHNAQPQLPSSAAGHAQPASEGKAENEQDEHCGNKEADCHSSNHQGSTLCDATQRRHEPLAYLPEGTLSPTAFGAIVTF